MFFFLFQKLLNSGVDFIFKQINGESFIKLAKKNKFSYEIMKYGEIRSTWKYIYHQIGLKVN